MAWDPLLLLDRIIVEGYHFTDLPSSWEMLGVDGYGVRRNSYPNIALKRTVVTQKAAPKTTTSFENFRKIMSQAYRITWQGPDTMGRCMYDHCRRLYSLSKSFYIQFDDVMTFDPAEPDILTNVGTNTRAYFTTNWPIKPFGWTPSAPTTYARSVFINNVPVDTASFTVDEELGMVQFNTALLSTDKVTMIYTWRMYVQIIEFNMQPAPGEVAPNNFVGEMIVEQVATPTGAPDLWLINLPCMGDSNIPSFSGTPLSLISTPIDPTEYLSYGIFNSDQSDPGATVPADTNHTSPTANTYPMPNLSTHTVVLP